MLIICPILFFLVLCQLAQIQSKSQFLFHKNIPPQNFSIMTCLWRDFVLATSMLWGIATIDYSAFTNSRSSSGFDSCSTSSNIKSGVRPRVCERLVIDCINSPEHRCCQYNTNSQASHYREVPRWDIFMEQELRFGLNLRQLALLKKKVWADYEQLLRSIF